MGNRLVLDRIKSVIEVSVGTYGSYRVNGVWFLSEPRCRLTLSIPRGSPLTSKIAWH